MRQNVFEQERFVIEDEVRRHFVFVVLNRRLRHAFVVYVRRRRNGGTGGVDETGAVEIVESLGPPYSQRFIFTATNKWVLWARVFVTGKPFWSGSCIIKLITAVIYSFQFP